MESKQMTAYFIDKKDRLQKAIIEMSDNYLEINTYDQAENPTAYTRIFKHNNDRFYLDTIYCYDEYRNSGIATFIDMLTEYLLINYDGFVIRGCYDPKQLSTDFVNKIERSKEELDSRARNFYKKAGYEVIDYLHYINNKDDYSYLEDDDFFRGEGGPCTIVAKPIIAKHHPFFVQDGVIYYDDNYKTTSFYDTKYVKVDNGDSFTYKLRDDKKKNNQFSLIKKLDKIINKK